MTAKLYIFGTQLTAIGAAMLCGIDLGLPFELTLDLIFAGIAIIQLIEMGGE